MFLFLPCAYLRVCCAEMYLFSLASAVENCKKSVVSCSLCELSIVASATFLLDWRVCFHSDLRCEKVLFWRGWVSFFPNFVTSVASGVCVRLVGNACGLLD